MENTLKLIINKRSGSNSADVIQENYGVKNITIRDYNTFEYDENIIYYSNSYSEKHQFTSIGNFMHSIDVEEKVIKDKYYRKIFRPNELELIRNLKINSNTIYSIKENFVKLYSLQLIDIINNSFKLEYDIVNQSVEYDGVIHYYEVVEVECKSIVVLSTIPMSDIDIEKVKSL